MMRKAIVVVDARDLGSYPERATYAGGASFHRVASPGWELWNKQLTNLTWLVQLPADD